LAEKEEISDFTNHEYKDYVNGKLSYDLKYLVIVTGCFIIRWMLELIILFLIIKMHKFKGQLS
jgi:hypothetical protein